MGICNSIQTQQDPRKRKTHVKRIDDLIVNPVCLNQNRIGQEYKIKEPIGIGSYGQVRKAVHLKTNSIRAVKIINKCQFSKENQTKIFKEINILSTLDHPNIIKTYEYFTDKKFIYIVTEFLSGGELFEKIKSEKNFKEEHAKKIFREILEGSIVHRDLKPENIMYEGDTLKIVDFGASKIFDPKKQMKNFHGTSYYIAPEVIEEQYSEKCDVWSCGVILYILLSGRPPFNGVNEEQILKAVKRGQFTFDIPEFKDTKILAKKLIKKMLNKNPQQRPSIEQCLNDQWFNEVNFKDDQNDAVSKNIMQNIKNFHTENQLHKSIYYFIVNQMISKEEKTQLMKIFKELDTNKDGVLSKEELIRGFENNQLQISEAEISELINQLDNNHNQNIDYSEFVVAAVNRKNILSEENMKTCFMLFDHDQNGKISTEEFKYLFANHEIVDDKVIKELIDPCDENHDGQIDFEEFQKILKQIANIPQQINQQFIYIITVVYFHNMVIMNLSKQN